MKHEFPVIRHFPGNELQEWLKNESGLYDVVTAALNELCLLALPLEAPNAYLERKPYTNKCQYLTISGSYPLYAGPAGHLKIGMSSLDTGRKNCLYGEYGYAKPNTVDVRRFHMLLESGMDYGRLSDRVGRLVISQVLNFISDADYNAIFGSATITGSKTRMAMLSMMPADIADSVGAVWHQDIGLTFWPGPYTRGKFEGYFEDCAFNAPWIKVTTAVRCNFFAINAIDYVYHLDFDEIADSTVATYLAFVDARHSSIKHCCIRQKSVDLKIEGEYVSCHFENLDGAMHGKAELTRFEDTKLEGYIEAFNSKILDSELTVQSLRLVASELDTVNGSFDSDLYIYSSKFKDSSISNTAGGRGAIRLSSLTNTTLVMGLDCQLYNVKSTGNAIVAGDNVVITNFDSKGSVSLGNGAKLYNCVMSSNTVANVAAGVKLEGVDLSLKTNWGLADSDPNLEVPEAGLDPRETKAHAIFGIPLMPIDLSNCVILEADWSRLPLATKNKFYPYNPAIYSYEPLSDVTGTPHTETVIADRLFKLDPNEEFTTTDQDAFDSIGLGKVLGCSKCKWYYDVINTDPNVYWLYRVQDIVDPRRP